MHALDALAESEPGIVNALHHRLRGVILERLTRNKEAKAERKLAGDLDRSVLKLNYVDLIPAFLTQGDLNVPM